MSQQERIVRYVMGELSEPEQSQTEEQYFAEAEFLHEVQAVCDDLVDAYLMGEMPAPDRDRFERRLHALPFLRDKLDTHRALLHFVQATARPSTKPAPKWRTAIAAWWARPHVLFPRLATAMAVGGLLLGGAWYLRFAWQANDNFERTVAQIAASPAATPSLQPSTASTVTARPKPSAVAKPSTPAHVLPVIASIVLSADVTRSEGHLAQLSFPSSNGVVRLQLELPPAQQRRYQVVLQSSEGQELKRWRNLLSANHQTISVVEVNVPADLLIGGEYLVKLSDETKLGYKFRFRVEPK